jgi:thiol:disulfide interchange protein DsbD
MSVKNDYHLYKESIKINTNNNKIILEDIILPQGKIIKHDFVDIKQEEYEGDNLIIIPFKGNGNFELIVSSQGCADKGLCYSPFTSIFKIKN